MADLSDPRLSEWRDESDTGIVWGRWWIGRDRRVAVVFEAAALGQHRFAWSVSGLPPAPTGEVVDAGGRAASVAAAKDAADAALARLLASLPIVGGSGG